MKNKKIIFLILFLLIIPNVVWGLDISFNNPFGSTGELTDFFKSVLQGILDIIAFLGVLFIVISGIVYLIASSTGNDAMLGTAKKILTGSLVGLILALSGPTLMNQIMDIVLNGAPTPTNLDEAPTLTAIVEETLSFLLSIIATIAIISSVVNGILYLFSGGDSSRAEQIKKNIRFSIIGFMVAGSALLLVRQIVWFIENSI